ncbi:MAG: TonB-dependent receptor [Candidatus Eiseniibacteriota bacterium]
MSRTSGLIRTLQALGVAWALIIVPTAVLAATTGKISGVVRERGKGPLPGVTVIVEGTRFGAIADDQGRYTIINVPAGSYTLRGRIVGYADYLVNDVVVHPDFTTDINLELAPDAIQQTPVIVEAGRPLIQKDATGTTRFLSSEDIQNLPTRGYRDAAALQTGIVNFQRNIDRENQNTPTLIVRGGRPNEVAYYVDGFSQQDPLTGNSTTNISNNAIEEVVVLTGGFNAEYGKVSSGVINVITREGGPKFFGSVEAVSDVISGGWVGTNRYDYNIYDASFGGPVIPNSDKLTFYVSGERRWQGDRSPRNLSPNLQSFMESEGAAEGMQINNGLSGWTGQAKFAWKATDAMNVKFGGLGSTDDWREFTQAYLNNIEHMPRYLDKNYSAFGQLNHTLNARSFYGVYLNYFQTERERGDGVHFDNLEGYSQPDGNPTFPTGQPYFFTAGHVWDDYLKRKSSYWGLKGDYTNQVNRYHQLRGGAEFQRHTLRYYNAYFPVDIEYDSDGNAIGQTRDIDRYGYDVDGKTHVDGDDIDGAKHPKTAALFAQDKYEREGVIVNAGLRLDYIDVATPALASEEYPLGTPPDDDLQADDLQDPETYLRLSPRLGVAFPVTDRTLLRVNYGQFFQQVNLQDLYVSYRFLEHKIRTGGYFVGFGNPNLKPERTTAYEVGVAHQLGERMRLDVTAYYKDVKDLVEITTIRSNPNAFASYRNRDFATIKGVDIGWVMRPVNHISAQLNYSLSYAQGTGSVSDTQRNPAWTASNVPKQTAPLDFDQRHKLTAGMDYRLGSTEGPNWLHNFGANVLFSVASGTPYTPAQIFDEVTLANVAVNPSGPINSRYGPWTSTLDLKVSKGFLLSNRATLNVFVWGLNVLDADNALTVYQGTGSPTSTNFLSTESGQAYINGHPDGPDAAVSEYNLAQQQSVFYSNPRLVRFGVSLGF